MTDLVTYSQSDGIATLHMDDGKVNALALTMTRALHAGLDRAMEEARVVVLRGRPGVFSAGFDLKVIRGGDEDAHVAMRESGYRLFRRLFTHPQPLIMALEGHAIAGGAVMLLGGDFRICAAGDWKIGLNELAIGMALPSFALEMARERLTQHGLTGSVLGARVRDPEAAKAAGFLDEVIQSDRLEARIAELAAALAALDMDAFAKTKADLRNPPLDRALDLGV